MSSPLAHKTNVGTNINVKNRTRRCAINLRGFSFAQHPISKFRGQGDTHRVKMKSKASSQTTNAVVAEWKTACDKARSCKLYKLSNKRLNTDGSGCTVTQSGNAIQDRTTQKTPRTTRKSPIQICVSPRKQKRSNSRTGPEPNQSKKARKRRKKSTLAASTLACCVSICTNNLEQTRNTRPITQFTMAGTLQVAKLWHVGFSYVQTSSKPCSNLKSMGPDHASRCDSILKESSIIFFLRAATVDFLRCLELRFDWGLHI